MRHILSILVENEAGALSRISGLFSARGYNIESLTVAPTEDPTMSRMTIVTAGSDDVIEQITKQLNKLVEVVKVVDLTEGNHIERELMLVKVRAAGKERDEMKRLTDIFRGRISVSRRSEEHTSELQSPCNLVCRLLLEKKKHNHRSCLSPRLPAPLTRQPLPPSLRTAGQYRRHPHPPPAYTDRLLPRQLPIGVCPPALP